MAGVHRSRLWAQHLPEFGWEPIIVTAHPDYYEEKLDPTLLDLVSPELRVIRTGAIPTKPVRFVGDIGVRALPWHFKVLDGLIAQQPSFAIRNTLRKAYDGTHSKHIQRVIAPAHSRAQSTTPLHGSRDGKSVGRQ